MGSHHEGSAPTFETTTGAARLADVERLRLRPFSYVDVN